MTKSPQEPSTSTENSSTETLSESPYEEGKRAGVHPVLVVFGIILGLWFLLWLYIPSSTTTKGSGPGTPPVSSSFSGEEDDPVMFHVKATLPPLQVITVVVPAQATDSQIAGLLYRFKKGRLENSLDELLPPTTPGHQLGKFALADIFIFSDPAYAKAEAVEVLARGAHAPGHLYPQAIPFETAMEQVRGHYRIDLNDPGHPDQASLGFSDDSGVHSKHYRPLF